MSEHFVRLVLNGAAAGCSTALDVGAGPGKYRPAGVEHWATLDVEPLGHSDQHYQCQALVALPKIGPRSFDLVYALDVIEHFNKADGARLLDEMERIAARRVLVFTPNGFMEQTSANPYQVHRSGWTREDFRARGYLTAVCDFDYGRPYKPGSLWAVKVVGR